MERLQKIIAQSGIASRRKAEELIKAGKVTVNGKVITELGTKVKSNDLIVCDGIRLQKEDKEYYLLHKPINTVSTAKDDKNRRTVVDFIDTKARIFPIGRLDYDTTGLILLTNDGELANLLMHPNSGVEKVYEAKIDGILNMEEFHKIKKGFEIDGYFTKPEKIKIKSKNKTTSTIEIVLVEGRNHIVKRIFEYVNHKVIKLKRTKYAFLDLENSSPGEFRSLTIKEVKKLYNLKQK